MQDVQGKELEHRLTSLQKDVEAHDERLDKHDKAFDRIDSKIEEIIKILSSRPTWLITAVITILTMIASNLITYVVTHH